VERHSLKETRQVYRSPSSQPDDGECGEKRSWLTRIARSACVGRHAILKPAQVKDTGSGKLDSELLDFVSRPTCLDMFATARCYLVRISRLGGEGTLPK
jgi:hypothetical protein